MSWFKQATETRPSIISFTKEEIVSAGEFLTFKNMPYYEKFITVLQNKATKSGLDAETADEALISIGERKAILTMINELRAEEHMAETILRASLKEKSIDETEHDTNFDW